MTTLNHLRGACKIISNPCFGKSRLRFEGVKEASSPKPGIRYHNKITTFFLRLFFGDKKIVDVKDIDGNVYHLNRGSLSNWLLANNNNLKNAKKNSLYTVTVHAMRRWLNEVLAKKSPNHIVRISDIKNDLKSKESSKKQGDKHGWDSIAHKNLPGEIAKLQKELAQLQKKRSSIPSHETKSSRATVAPPLPDKTDKPSRTGKETSDNPTVKSEETTSPPPEKILDQLLSSAEKEGDAYLIDFSVVKPSTIFEIFQENRGHDSYGGITLSTDFDEREAHKFTMNFPNKYAIGIKFTEDTSHVFNFTMNEAGKVEYYGKVFDDFKKFIGYNLNEGIHAKERFAFEHFNFRSKNYKTLRFKKVEQKDA